MPTDEVLKLMSSSMQYSDRPTEQREDAEQVFDLADQLGVAVIGFSEATRHGSVFPELAAAAHRHDWFWQRGITGDYRFAVSPSCEVLENGYVHVLDAAVGHGPHHSKRGVAEVTFRTAAGNVITDHGSHWLTGFQLDRKPGAEGPRERQHREQTDAMIERVQLHAAGRRLSFWQGDTNVDEQRDTGFDRAAIEARFAAHGLESIYDERFDGNDQLPSTHGRRTIDVIGSIRADRRVTGRSVRVVKRNGRHADHLIVVASYDVAATR